MPLFRCAKCGCVENTALSCLTMKMRRGEEDKLCSECNPMIGKWHGEFPKEPATGLILCTDGYVYEYKPRHTSVVGILQEDGSTKKR